MLKKRISFIALVITGSLTLFVLYVWNSFKGVVSTGHSYSTIDHPESDTAFGGIFYLPHIPDSLPYSKYRMIDDSFKKVKLNIDLNNSGSHINGLFNSTFGFGEIKDNLFSLTPPSTFNTDSDSVMKVFVDSMNRVYPNPTEKEINDRDMEIEKKFQERMKDKYDAVKKEQEKDKSYYFALNGYELNDYDSRFYIKDNTYNLAYVKWDTVIKKGQDSFPHGHYESKQLKVRYASANKRILIPVSENTYTVLKIVQLSFTLLTFILIVYFFFGLPVQVLVNISRGKVFTKRNISMLEEISWVALIIALLTIISPYLFKLIFWKMIPGDFILEPFFNALLKNLAILVMAVVAFFIAKAFKRGYKLQQYEDLTI